MKKLLNTEIAEYVYEELNKKSKEYDIEYSRILDLVDDSIASDTDFEKDENGEIARKLTEEEIIDLKERMLDGIETYFDYCNDSTI